MSHERWYALLVRATGEGTFSGIAVREEDRGFLLLRGRLSVG